LIYNDLVPKTELKPIYDSAKDFDISTEYVNKTAANDYDPTKKCGEYDVS